MKTWLVPYSRTCHGMASVEAKTAGEAERLVEAGDFEPSPGEEQVDWRALGFAKEDK